MTDGQLEILTALIGIVILGTLVASIVSVIYIVRIYSRSKKTSRLFRMLVRADAIKVGAATWIALAVVLRLTGNPLPPWTMPITATAVEILLIPPILHAVEIYRLRRSGRNDVAVE